MKGKTSRSSEGSDLRARLIQAALDILDDPETPLELRKVAEAAGKSRTAPYLVFGKESEGGGLSALRMAVAAEGADLLAEQMEAARATTRDPRLAFQRVSRALFAFATERERLFRLMFSPEIGTLPLSVGEGADLHPEFRRLVAARTRGERVVLDVVRAVQADRTLPDGNPLRHSIAAWALLVGIAFLLLDRVLRAAGVETSVEEGAQLATEIFLGSDAQSLTKAALALLAAEEEKGSPQPPEEVARMYRDIRDSQPPRELRDLTPTWGDVTPTGRDLTPLEPLTPRRDFVDDVEATEEGGPSGSTEGEEGKWSLDPASEGPASHVWRRRGRRRAPEEAGASGADLSRAYERAGRTISSEGSLRRAALAGPALRGARILWIDDHPKGILWERRTLEELGVRIAPAWSTEVALERLAEEPFDLVISDIARGDRADEGVRALPRLRAVQPDIPVVFYIAALEAERGPPAGSVGITNRMGELLHLVLDVLERRRL